MKIDKFVYKLIDHDARTVQKFCVKILCSHKAEWDQPDMIKEKSLGMNPAHQEWKTKHMAWQQATKETVAKLIKTEYPAIADYTLSCCEECSECKMKNINHGKGTSSEPMHMMRIHSMEKYKMKYCKGTKSETRHGAREYECTVHEYVFKASLNGSGTHLLTIAANGETAVLSHLANFSFTKSDSGLKFGGDSNKEKYMKYKYKYLDLKQKGGNW